MKLRLIVLAIIALLPVALLEAALAAPPSYRVKIVRVIDGDTFLTDRAVFGRKQKIRVNGIDTPETDPAKAQCGAEIERGKAAKAFAISMADKALNRATLRRIKPEAYNERYLADVFLMVDGKRTSWAEAMIAAGHAKPYLPNKTGSFAKPDWCAPATSKAEAQP